MFLLGESSAARFTGHDPHQPRRVATRPTPAGGRTRCRLYVLHPACWHCGLGNRRYR